ncbi:hypothetical protein [Actinomycetospora aeridis]|uniref:SRPBCC family protein n=1 Tax=Actinomycetospora aeridis TaxID=3129231 RepID=A0ABU8N447_9PSEU
MGLFDAVAATATEQDEPRPGDELVAPADVVMDRAFTLADEPAAVWPWIVQLGKRRAGWYLPARVERFVPRRRRAAVRVVDRWQHLAVGNVIPDYGGRDETFVVDEIDPPHTLVYRSRRGRTDVSWSITLRPVTGGTRVHLRLRLGPVRHVRLAETVGDAFDAVTIAGMAAGLRERLAVSPPAAR